MKLITSIKKMQTICARLKGKSPIGFVPTMGFLHAGHVSLARLARKKAETVVVSIFVNPRQFGKNEDFSRYPRNLKHDLRLLKQAGVSYVFVPSVLAMYPEAYQTSVDVSKVSQPLCGIARPGHFCGVATVVLKLFNIVQPDIAVFGRKDYQQLLVIKRLVQDLNLPIRILAQAIVREPDGLAMSSRNTYLTPPQRRLALCLSRGLNAVKKACFGKNLGVKKLRGLFLQECRQDRDVRVDYIEILHACDLNPLTKYRKGRTLVACAVFIGKTRLIDNMVI